MHPSNNHVRINNTMAYNNNNNNHYYTNNNNNNNNTNNHYEIFLVSYYKICKSTILEHYAKHHPTMKRMKYRWILYYRSYPRLFVLFNIVCFILFINTVSFVSLYISKLMYVPPNIEEIFINGTYQPNPDQFVSVVVMNHARPAILFQSPLLLTLLCHPNINEIIICHSNIRTMFNSTHLYQMYQIEYYKQQQQQQQVALLQQQQNNQLSIEQQNQQNQQIETKYDPINTMPRINNLQELENLIQQKIKHVDAIATNKQFGLALRFYYCSVMATNPYVIHVDDDMVINTTTINMLLYYVNENPYRIIGGRYGRSYNYWRRPFRHGYHLRYDGPTAEVVLTKILIAERTICTAFFNYTYLVEADIVLPYSKPKWNGEDIFFNLVANYYYYSKTKHNRKNFTVTTVGNSENPMIYPFNNYAIPNLPSWEANDTALLFLPERINTSNGVVPSSTDVTELQAFVQQQQQQQQQQQSTTTTKALVVVDDSSSGNRLKTSSTLSICGNIDRFNIWDAGYWKAYIKTEVHMRYRGKLWYYAKQRLVQLTSRRYK